MKFLQVGIIAIFGVLVSGCKAEFFSRINVSALENNIVSNVPATMKLEVLGCHEFDDSRNSSDSLIKAQEAVPRVFPDAEFKECYSQGMHSWAEFSLNFSLDRNGDPDAFSSVASINLTTTSENPLGIAMPPVLAERLKEAYRANAFLDGFNYRFEFDLVNDTDEVFSSTLLAGWIDDEPYTLATFKLDPGESVTLRLPEVIIERAMMNSGARVLIDFDRLISKRDS